MLSVKCNSAPMSALKPCPGVSRTPAWTPLPSLKSINSRTPAPSRGRSMIVKAEDMDFDAYLAKAADQFEKLDNKPVVIGYGAAAVVALLITEWLIHLPGLNILLGFPAQLLGLLVAPVLVLRYFVDNENLYEDVEAVIGKVGGLLPGLKK